MPGTLMHLAFAKMVYCGINKKIKEKTNKALDKNLFYAGNILPDEAKDKGLSHYRIPSKITGYRVPDLEEAKKELLDFENPVKLGSYCHLYFDYHFLENYVFSCFDWNENIVVSKANGLRWINKDFWTHSEFYSAYGEFNEPIINDKLFTLDEVDEIPDILPTIGISYFDKRRDKIWKNELIEFLKLKLPCTNRILDYSLSIKEMRKIADKLINELI